MPRIAARSVGDLVPAARPSGDDQGVPVCRPHRGQEVELAHRHRRIVVRGFVAEGAGHAAAARRDGLDLQPGNETERALQRRHGAERLLMAVAVQERTLARE